MVSLLLLLLVFLSYLVVKLLYDSLVTNNHIAINEDHQKVYESFVQSITMVSGVLVLSILIRYYTVIRLDLMDKYVVTFIILWMLFCVIITRKVFNYVDTLKKYEKIATNPAAFQALKSLYVNKINEDYFIMRLNFISPANLPVFTEMFLRMDFDFAEYINK